MIMSYRHRDHVISDHYSNKTTSAKSIDKICAKLQLHIDPDKHTSELVEHIKKEIVDLPVDLQLKNGVIEEESLDNIALDDSLKQEVECGSDICTTTDVDMYSSDSPKSSYNPCPSSPAMAYLKDSSSSPLNATSADNICTKYDNGRHNSSVIVCTHDNSAAMYDMCPVSPVFVSTHDDIHMSYDIHPTSPVIDHMMSKHTTSYDNNIPSNSSPVANNVDEVDMTSENVSSTSPPVEGARDNYTPPANDASSPSPPTAESQESEKTESKTNKVKPRHTTQYNNWHHNDMIMAIKAVQMKYLSMTAAAKRYGIPRTTLRHYLHDGTNRETKRACFSLQKKSEDDLVQYALDNCHVNEKALYKLIFDKAKEFSQGAVLETGEDGRRVVPTPAWIRRFVYRHKQLHNIFPTFLAKWEHPVIDRKLPNDKEDYSTCNGTHENNTKVGKDKVCTEIIFPKGKYDNYYSPHIYDGSKTNVSCSEQQIQSRIDNCVTQVKSLLSRTSNEIGGDAFLDGEPRRNNSVKSEKFPSDDERIVPYKDLLSRISKPPYTKMTSSHNSQMLDLNYSPPHHRHERKNSDSVQNLSLSDPSDLRSSQYVNLSSIPIIRSSQYSSKTDSTTTSVAEMHIGNDLDETTKNDVSYSEKLRSLVKPLSSDDKHTNDSSVNFSEFDVLKITLHAMEESLGVDYVQLFTERYCRNKSLERLYGKWVSLRSELDLTD